MFRFLSFFVFFLVLAFCTLVHARRIGTRTTVTDERARAATDRHALTGPRTRVVCAPFSAATRRGTDRSVVVIDKWHTFAGIQDRPTVTGIRLFSGLLAFGCGAVIHVGPHIHIRRGCLSRFTRARKIAGIVVGIVESSRSDSSSVSLACSQSRAVSSRLRKRDGRGSESPRERQRERDTERETERERAAC